MYHTSSHPKARSRFRSRFGERTGIAAGHRGRVRRDRATTSCWSKVEARNDRRDATATSSRPSSSGVRGSTTIGMTHRRDHGADARPNERRPSSTRNVLIDVLDDDPNWDDWSRSATRGCAARRRARHQSAHLRRGLAIHFDDSSRTSSSASRATLSAREICLGRPRFSAGKAFLQLSAARRRPKRSPLPDFYIGAHAALKGYALLTRDPRRYRTVFSRR